MSRALRLRSALIGALVAAAVLSVVGKKSGSLIVSWLSFACFLVAVFLYFTWRRTVADERRASVFDREAKTTDETRTGPDE